MRQLGNKVEEDERQLKDRFVADTMVDDQFYPPIAL